jgi:uncharacterized protein (TIGR03435 family)
VVAAWATPSNRDTGAAKDERRNAFPMANGLEGDSLSADLKRNENCGDWDDHEADCGPMRSVPRYRERHLKITKTSRGKARGARTHACSIHTRVNALRPSTPAPTEFEVASVKPADVSVRTSRYQMQPGGRLIAEGMSLRFLIGRAFNTANDDQVVGAPKFTDSDRYDIFAQAPSAGPSVAPLDDEVVAPMLRALLAARFRMTYHWEDRPVNAYSLVSVKPKMKKADPASRTFCRAYFDVGAPQGSRVLTCRNIAMAQFVTMLHDNSPELRWPLQDATGIEGGWDFTMTFGWPAAMTAGAGDVPSAADPAGRYTFAEAVEKQLGLKLEKQKRPMPVIVIDHIEQKPTDN